MKNIHKGETKRKNERKAKEVESEHREYVWSREPPLQSRRAILFDVAVCCSNTETKSKSFQLAWFRPRIIQC